VSSFPWLAGCYGLMAEVQVRVKDFTCSSACHLSYKESKKVFNEILHSLHFDLIFPNSLSLHVVA